MVDFIEEVEKFIKRRDNGEFTINPQVTNNIWYPYKVPKGVPKGFEQPYRQTLSDCLADSIQDYISNMSTEMKLGFARECYKWINAAWSTGAIEEGQGLLAKLEGCKAINAELEKRLQELSEKYLEATKKVEMFEKKFPPLTGKK